MPRRGRQVCCSPQPHMALWEEKEQKRREKKRKEEKRLKLPAWVQPLHVHWLRLPDGVMWACLGEAVTFCSYPTGQIPPPLSQTSTRVYFVAIGGRNRHVPLCTPPSLCMPCKKNGMGEQGVLHNAKGGGGRPFQAPMHWTAQCPALPHSLPQHPLQRAQLQPKACCCKPWTHTCTRTHTLQ